MSKNQLIDSLGRIDDDILQNVDAVRTGRKRKVAFQRWLSSAACFALVLGAALTAEATNGTVSNLLAPIFGGVQTEIVDAIGVPVGAAASVNGYTLTAEAIIGDRYSVLVAYTLTRDDGQPIPEGIDFQDKEIFGSGYSTKIDIDEEDPSVARFHQRTHRNGRLQGRNVTPSFSTLVIDDRNDDTEDPVVAEGTWELELKLRYPDSTEKLPVKSFDIKDSGGRRYKVRKIMLSPIGVHLDLTFYDPDYTDGIFKDFKISLIMKDGTVLPLEGGGGGGWTEGDKKADVDYYAEFDIPIPREDIRSIVICDVVYELNS